jgi:hypothetical protein
MDRTIDDTGAKDGLSRSDRAPRDRQVGHGTPGPLLSMVLCSAKSNRRPSVADLAFIVTIFVFFALCVAFIRGLDRIVRSTEEVELRHEEVTP